MKQIVIPGTMGYLDLSFLGQWDIWDCHSWASQKGSKEQREANHKAWNENTWERVAGIPAYGAVTAAPLDGTMGYLVLLVMNNTMTRTA